MESKASNFARWLAALKENVLPVGAATAFIVAIVLACLGNVPAAALVAAMFLVSTLFIYLPRIEYIKAFSVEARLTRTLDDAENLLKRLKSLVSSTSKQAIIQIAWMNRMGSLSYAEKAISIAEIDKLMQASAFDPDEVLEVKRPFLSMVGTDLYGIFKRVLDLRIKEAANLIRLEQAAIFPGNVDPSSPEFARWNALKQEINELQEQNASASAMKIHPREYATWLVAQIPASPRLDGDRAKLRELADRIIEIFNGCLKAGTISPEAIHLIEEEADYKRQEEFYKTVFPI
jgi:hypothetical protein